MQALRERHPEWHFARSATTRARRNGEGDDQYVFVHDKEFDQLLQNDALLEWAEVHKSARYGILKDDVVSHLDQGQIVIREIDVQGFEVVSHHPLFLGPEAPYTLTSIFILPESREQLIEHITARAPISDNELQKRLESIERELVYTEKCTYQVVSREDKLDELIEEIEEKIG